MSKKKLDDIQDNDTIISIDYDGVRVITKWEDKRLNLLMGVLKMCWKINSSKFEEISLMNLIVTDTKSYKPYKLFNPIYFDSNMKLLYIKEYIKIVTSMINMDYNSLVFTIEDDK